MFCQGSFLKFSFKSFISVSVFACTQQQNSGRGKKSVAFIYLCSRSIPALLPQPELRPLLPAAPILQKLTLSGPCLLCFRTVYYTGYRQVYEVRYQTAYRCCPGWSQLAGDAGCLYRKYPRLRVPPALSFWLRMLISSPVPPGNAATMSLKGTLCCCLFVFFNFLFIWVVCQIFLWLPSKPRVCFPFLQNFPLAA